MSNFKIGTLSMTHSMNGVYPQASTYLDYIQNRRGKILENQRQLFDTADEKMKRIHDIIWQIADTEIPVLITGEKGVGKKLIAKAIHEAGSSSQEKPFFSIDCKHPNLEEELFGKEGLIHKAQNGILLLNEITASSSSVQKKLLNFLQDSLLSQKDLPSLKLRLLATTDANILKAVSQGKFRQDLYYRLYVIHFEVPPLRDRPKDIMLLSQKFLDDFCERTERSRLLLSEKAMEKLKKHEWARNITDLKMIVEKAANLCRGDLIGPECIPFEGEEKVHNLDWIQSLPVGQTLDLVETHFILKTLDYHNGNRTHAAKTLGISLRTLRNKINEFTAAGYEVPLPQMGRSLSTKS